MALITRSATASVDANHAAVAGNLSGDLIAGEALDPAAPCYIAAADGLVYMSDGTADNEASRVHGFTPQAYASGEAVTLLLPPVRFGYDRAGGMTGQNPVYVGATAGRLDDAATTGGATAIGFCIDAYDVMFTHLKVEDGS